MELTKRYESQETEEKWYAHWMEKNYFHSTPDDRESFSIVIPPPNVTGVLHMGHMLNNTIQDILIRKARLSGKNACWVPGTDHASIATEAKVVKMLREQGIKKSDLSRDEFLKYAWEWKEKYGGIILQQLRKLGASADWERTAFTMDEERSKWVVKVFVDLYKKGKLYRGLRMVNWDPEAQTVLSNEEVLYSEENAKLYHVRYQVEGTDEWLTIATTRPETIPGDTGVAINPKDERYQHLKGKRVIIPIVNRSVPIIFDDYVDMEFGTGALKITPAHDVNDYEIGKRHNLEVVDVLNDNGTMSEAAQVYVGEDRMIARKKIAKDLDASGNLVEVEDYPHNVGRSERTNVVVEPKLSLQWYVDMKAIAGPALEGVMTDDVEFFPKNQKNTYSHWMENIRDWCISRQLWWGHRIPAWSYGEDVFVAESVEEALAEAQQKTGNANLTAADLKQDEDVLDTWFSSWLWPISVFNDEERDYYYPTSVVVTGADIIFLWIARMVMAGYEWKNERPFEAVYFTGMVRDQQRRKMSKSLGNSPDALKLIETYGADGVRFGMLSSSPAGGDLLFDEKLCLTGKNFCNKMWNALRLVKSWDVVEKPIDEKSATVNKLAAEWFENKLNQVLVDLEHGFKTYRLSEALTTLYSFFWDDFCSWYLEMIKPEYEKPIDQQTIDQAINFFERLMTIIHPFMPFITEDIWHRLRDRKAGEDCIVSAYPTETKFDADLLKKVSTAMDVISKIREIRTKNGVKNKETLPLFAENSDRSKALFELDGVAELITKLGNLDTLDFTDEEIPNSMSFLSGTEKYFITLNITIDVEAERERISKELEYAKGFVGSIEKKLSNERFVNNAPEQVVANERRKLEDGQAKIKLLEESLTNLN